MSSDPPRHGRRTFPRNYTFDFLMLRGAPRRTACGTHAHASGAVRPRFARRHDDPEVMVAICMHRRFIPDDRPTIVGLARHACDSCLQHGALRFGLFSFCCPRLLYVRPTEAIARPLLHPRSRSRHIQICKERTMLHCARLRGPMK
jgi:hypothetical protein